VNVMKSSAQPMLPGEDEMAASMRVIDSPSTKNSVDAPFPVPASPDAAVRLSTSPRRPHPTGWGARPPRPEPLLQHEPRHSFPSSYPHEFPKTLFSIVNAAIWLPSSEYAIKVKSTSARTPWPPAASSPSQPELSQ